MCQPKKSCSDATSPTRGPLTSSSSSNLPSSNRLDQSRQTKTVTFSSTARLLIIPTIDDYTDEERANTWGTEDDKRTSEKETIDSIKLYMYRRRNSFIASDHRDSTTIRGLENLSSKEASLKYRNRRDNYIGAVLNEQDCQWEHNDAPCYDDESEALRAVAKRYSAESIHLAISLAEGDAAYVRRQQKLDNIV